MQDFLMMVILDSTSGNPITPESIADKLVPNLWDFLVQLLAFIVLVIAIIIFAYRPIKKILNKRSDYINNQIQSSEEANRLAALNRSESEAYLLETKKNANKIITDAKESALIAQKEILLNADKEAKEKLIDADNAIKQAVKHAHEDMKNVIVDVAIETSKKVLKREVTKEDNQRLIDDFLSDSEKH